MADKTQITEALLTPGLRAFIEKATPALIRNHTEKLDFTKAIDAARKHAKATGGTVTAAVDAAAKKFRTTAGGTWAVKGTPLGNGNFLTDLLGSHTTKTSPTATKKAPAKKVAASTTNKAPTTSTLEKEIATGPFSKILQSVTSEYQPAEEASAAAASGSLTAPATQGAWAEALQSLSGTPAVIGETPSAWLGQNLATSEKVSAPLTNAMNAYGTQLQAEQGPILQNLTALGQGLEEEVDTAPESPWLSALGSHITSNLSYYGTIPSAAVPSLPSGIATALQQSGGYGGGSSGLIPVSSLTTKGATAKAGKTASGITGAALTGAGSIPGSSSVPGQ